jgi:type VI secretion system protein VasD
MRYGIAIFLFILMTCALCACMTKTLSIHAQSSGQLNVDDQANSLPVIVRVYQLNSEGRFMSSSFNELWQNSKNALGDSLLSENEFILNPGDKKIVKFHSMENAKYIGAIGIFRTPASEHWRVIQPVSKNEPYASTHLSLRLIDNHIYVESEISGVS